MRGVREWGVRGWGGVVDEGGEGWELRGVGDEGVRGVGGDGCKLLHAKETRLSSGHVGHLWLMWLVRLTHLLLLAGC